MTAIALINPCGIPSICADVMQSYPERKKVIVPGPVWQALNQKGPGTSGREASHRKIMKFSRDTCLAFSVGDRAGSQLMSAMPAIYTNIAAIETSDKKQEMLSILADDHKDLGIIICHINRETLESFIYSSNSQKYFIEPYGDCISLGSGSNYLQRSLVSSSRKATRWALKIYQDVKDNARKEPDKFSNWEMSAKIDSSRYISRLAFSEINSKFVLRDINDFSAKRRPEQKLNYGGYLEFCHYDVNTRAWAGPSAHVLLIISADSAGGARKIELAVAYDSDEGGAILSVCNDSLSTRSSINVHRNVVSADGEPFNLAWRPAYLAFCVCSRSPTGHLRFEGVEVEEDVRFATMFDDGSGTKMTVDARLIDLVVDSVFGAN